MTDSIDLTTTEKSVTIRPHPMFPHTVKVGGVAIILHADGTWEGDAQAYLDAVQKIETFGGGFGFEGVVIWMIANAMRRKADFAGRLPPRGRYL